MADDIDRSGVMTASRAGGRTGAVLVAWLLVAAILTLCQLAGSPLNGDFDDVLKLEKVRAFLETGAWFDQSIPGILQPEPFVSHWPRLLDLPYAAASWIAQPAVGPDNAPAFAAFIVPLALLLPALFLLRRIVATLGFERPDIAFLLALIPAMRGFFEFAPDRVDYHNVQIVLLLASVVLTLSRRVGAAALNGAVVALALATSIEFAPFFALTMAVLTAEFILGREDGMRLGLFGAALAATALIAYAAIVAPENYGGIRCDSYSTPHLLALVLAACSFVGAAALGGWIAGPLPRASFISLAAAGSLALIAFSYPECLAGPYAGMNAYARDALLADIAQEQSLFARPDFVLSASLVGAVVLFVGALAPAAVVATERFHHRGRLIFALFALIALASALVQFRYSRYLPLFGGPGIVLGLAAALPRLRTAGAPLALRLGDARPSALGIVAPGLLVGMILVVVNSLSSAPERMISAATYAGSCDLGAMGRHAWPPGTRVLAPPLVGIGLLPEMAEAAVVAVPFHTGAAGVERAARFLDPATDDPHLVLNESRATHVAVCAWRSDAPPGIVARYPFAASLMEGEAPDWLVECPTDAGTSIRIFRYPAAGRFAERCPSPR